MLSCYVSTVRVILRHGQRAAMPATAAQGPWRHLQPEGQVRARRARYLRRRLGLPRGAAGRSAVRRRPRCVPDAGRSDASSATPRRTSRSTQSINPYRGCEHGCIYCYARPSHAYLGLSPGLDFETKIFAKLDAAPLLERELARPGYRCQPIALGTNTDPYQPLERRLRITRAVLEVLARRRHPVAIVTKSAAGGARHRPAGADGRRTAWLGRGLGDHARRAALARTLEPRAAAPHRRLERSARWPRRA